MPQYSMGHLDRVSIIREQEQHHPGIFLAGASYSGVGVPDCVTAGQSAAKAALEFVRS
jgi:protoporphyrinogen/coproporphyrinogen III oxidase